MRKLAFLILLLSMKSHGLCPDSAKNESPSDCPWAEITREILEPAKKCEGVLKKRTPYILKQLKMDLNSPEAISLWGTAKNFDDNAKATIVDLKILNCLTEKLNLKSSIQQQAGFETIHAGVQHTYAYLFSNLMTPYGYKRARWTKDDLQKGLGLSPLLLTPQTKHGAFLTNVTYLFAKFAFKDDAALLKKLENKSLAPELLKFKAETFEVKNVKETIAEKNFVLHTTFVKLLPGNTATTNTHLLIYWIENTTTHSKSLITGFPVEQSFVDKAFDPKNMGPNRPISLRYNVWVNEVSDSKTTLTGLREVIN